MSCSNQSWLALHAELGEDESEVPGMDAWADDPMGRNNRSRMRQSRRENLPRPALSVFPQLDTIKRQRFEQSLALLFTPWQIEILEKRALNIPLSDAERQELSRRIKPKVLALDDLRDLKLLLPFFE